MCNFRFPVELNHETQLTWWNRQKLRFNLIHDAISVRERHDFKRLISKESVLHVVFIYFCAITHFCNLCRFPPPVCERGSPCSRDGTGCPSISLLSRSRPPTPAIEGWSLLCCRTQNPVTLDTEVPPVNPSMEHQNKNVNFYARVSSWRRRAQTPPIWRSGCRAVGSWRTWETSICPMWRSVCKTTKNIN